MWWWIERGILRELDLTLRAAVTSAAWIDCAYLFVGLFGGIPSGYVRTQVSSFFVFHYFT